jgi:ATP-dependent 26S proteasome regulatory subunit
VNSWGVSASPGTDQAPGGALWVSDNGKDCDELIRGEASQPLSRLLNLTDGLLGQGRQVLVAITTNEDLRRLHPAVVRPGRCLAHIEFGSLRSRAAAAVIANSSASCGCLHPVII